MVRVRIGLRLMLLLVALAAVCFATVGTMMQVYRANEYPHRLGIETRLQLLEIQRRSELKEAADLEDAEQKTVVRKKLTRTEAAIAEARKLLDEMSE